MKKSFGLELAVLGGAVLGAIVVNLHAQGKAPGAYAVVDIGAIIDLDTFKTLLPKTNAAITAFGGRTIVATENVVALDGTAPKRFAIIAFDNMDKAKAWDASTAQKEIDAIREKSTKSRLFIVEGLPN